MEAEELKKKTIAELKAMLKEKGLKTHGKKEDLMNRLLRKEDDGPNDSAVDQSEDSEASGDDAFQNGDEEELYTDNGANDMKQKVLSEEEEEYGEVEVGEDDKSEEEEDEEDEEDENEGDEEDEDEDQEIDVAAVDAIDEDEDHEIDVAAVDAIDEEEDSEVEDVSDEEDEENPISTESENNVVNEEEGEVKEDVTSMAAAEEDRIPLMRDRATAGRYGNHTGKQEEQSEKENSRRHDNHRNGKLSSSNSASGSREVSRMNSRERMEARAKRFNVPLKSDHRRDNPSRNWNDRDRKRSNRRRNRLTPQERQKRRLEYLVKNSGIEHNVVLDDEERMRRQKRLERFSQK